MLGASKHVVKMNVMGLWELRFQSNVSLFLKAHGLAWIFNRTYCKGQGAMGMEPG